MRKQAPVIDWIIAEDDADWERRNRLPLPDNAPAARRQRPWYGSAWGVASLFLLLVVIGGWSGRTPQRRAHQAEQWEPSTGIQLAGQQASADQQTTMARWVPFTQRTGDLAASHQTLDVVDPLNLASYTADMQGDLTVTRVVTMVNDRPYRQTIFYRRTAAGWQQVYPDTLSWGPERRMETPSFVFHFRQRDAAAVVAVAPQVEALYRTMRHNLDLPITPGAEKLVIDVSVTQPPGYATPWFVAPDPIIAPSPALYQAPVELTDTELLAQSLALPLFEHVLAQAHQDQAIPAIWQPLERAWRLWQLWDLDLPLAAWREEIVKWIYSDLPTKPPGQGVVLPQRYRELCAAYMLWLLAPAQIHVPLYCTDLDQQRWFFYWQRSIDLPVRLAHLAAPLDRDAVLVSDMPVESQPDQTIALVTLLDYVVVIYGHERLPTLVAGLRQHKTWETLLPAVFDVTAAEFEVGWQAYLTAHYGVLTPVNLNP